MAYPHKWSPISYRSSAGQGKFAGQRLTFYQLCHVTNCRYTTLWNMNAEKWRYSEIRIAINDESHGSIAKNLRCDELLYYTFIIHSAGERIFQIGEHVAKLQAKWLTVSYTPFALHFFPQRCRSRQISWITCVLQTETVIKRCCVNRQINVS